MASNQLICKQLFSMHENQGHIPNLNPGAALKAEFGNMDIYLFDQLLKGRLDGRKRILDAGCGGGRNLEYFIRNGFDVYGMDRNPEAIEAVVGMASLHGMSEIDNHFKLAAIEDKCFPMGTFDLVICNAVLHFADNQAHFGTMLRVCWQYLKPGGIFFCRLATKIGIADRISPIRNGRYLLPDGSVRYLTDLEEMLKFSELLEAKQLEPIKTTDVQGLRSMTTWVLEKI